MAGQEGNPTHEEALQLWKFMESGEPMRHPWKHETNPRHKFHDNITWPLLRPVMNTFAQGKITHWWHWNNLPEEIDLEKQGGVLLAGNKESFSLEADLHAMRVARRIAMSLGGWDEAYIIGPDMEKTTPEQLSEGWRYAFEGRANDPRRQYCAIIVHGPIRILAGLDDFVVGSLKPFSMETVPIKSVGPFPHRAGLPLL